MECCNHRFIKEDCLCHNCNGSQCNASKEMETCLICFGGYLLENAKDHQCPEFYNCGACGEICDTESGTITNSNGEGNFGEFTHNAELCPAQDEIGE